MFLDLTHLLEEGMPVYPGTEDPRISVATTYEEAGFRETRLDFMSHVGTHLDCPAHLYPGGPNTSSMNISSFAGKGLVVDCSHLGEHGIIDADLLNGLNSSLQDKEFILFYTGWAHKWKSPGYFSAYPTFSREAISLLATMDIKGIGIDAISIDASDATYLTNHQIFLERGNKIIVENLCNLEYLLGKEFRLFAFPLKLAGGDGSPIRAVAEIMEPAAR